MGIAAAMRATSSDQVPRQGRQQAGAVAGHHVVVDRRDRRRQADLELDVCRDHARPTQPLEHTPGLKRHVGVAGLEGGGIGLGARLQAKSRNLADQLAVPLDEPERRHVARDLDRRIVGQHVLQELDPGLADTGLAVRQTRTRCGPTRPHTVRNTVSASGSGMLPTRCTMGCLLRSAHMAGPPRWHCVHAGGWRPSRLRL